MEEVIRVISVDDLGQPIGMNNIGLYYRVLVMYSTKTHTRMITLNVMDVAVGLTRGLLRSISLAVRASRKSTVLR